jgi:hypothetical protein
MLLILAVSRWLLVAKGIVPVQAEAGVAGTMGEKAREHWQEGGASENVVRRDAYKEEH